MRLRGIVMTICIVLAFAAFGTAYAGGPFVVDQTNNTGVALRWESDTLKWCADPGDLSDGVDHDEAVTWISEAFSKWEGITLLYSNVESEADTVAVSIEQETSGCPTDDITIDNFWDYFNADEGPTVIVFDETGEIISYLEGPENVDGIVGLSVPLASDDSGLYITKGIAIFNGRMLATDNDTLGSTLATKSSFFKVTVLHELGHLLNLDHSQTNYDEIKYCELGESCAGANYIPTMYPQLLNTAQSNPSRDDEVTLSLIYPTQDFDEKFCTITGEILDGDGNPLKGVHVTATRAAGVTTPFVEARSFVSGALYPLCEGDGRYHLRGIVPGRSYKVFYEAIGSEFAGSSDFEPLGDASPSGFDSGDIEGPDGETTVQCSEGGQTIEMASVEIDVSNPCGGSSGSPGSSTTGTTGVKCGLVEGSPFAVSNVAAAASLIAALLFILGMRIPARSVSKRKSS